jgi:hypothetical protein
MLDIDLSELALVFKRDPWVKSVTRIRKSYGSRGPEIVVELVYRQPVARAKFSDGTKVAIDDEGVLLPIDEIDWKFVNPQIEICNEESRPPADRHPGTRWKAARDDKNLPEADPRIVEAAQLAGFLTRVQANPNDSPPSLQFLSIYPRTASNPLFTRNGEGLWVQWSKSLGPDLDDEPANDRKWSMLREWLKRPNGSASPKSPDTVKYLTFTRSGIEPVYQTPRGHQ